MLGVFDIDFLRVFFYYILFGVPWGMYGKLPEMKIKRCVFVFSNKFNGFQCHAVFQVFTRFALVGIDFPRRKPAIGQWAGGRCVRDVDVESVLKRAIRLCAQVPFPNVRGFVSGIAKYR